MKGYTVFGIVATGVSIVVFAFALTGCSGAMTNHDFTMTGTKEGIDAFYKGQIGSLKAMVEPKTKSLYMNSRDREDVHITKRNEDGKTFWQRLVSRAKAEQKESK